MPNDTLSQAAAALGKKGGKSRSPRKLDAIAANLEQAHIARRVIKPCPICGKVDNPACPACVKRMYNRRAARKSRKKDD